MSNRQIYDNQLHAQFITFSCYRRRHLLDTDPTRQVILDILSEELHSRDGVCCGYVVMSNHVHAIVWFPETEQLSSFVQNWKSRSSKKIKFLLRSQAINYADTIDLKEPIWLPKYYSLNLFTESKAKEKLDYMHSNPVAAGLVERACGWKWSSARYFELGESTEVPMKWVFD